MIPLSVAQVAAVTGAVLADGADPAALITAPTVIDSEGGRAEPGSLFAALLRCPDGRA